MFTLSNDKIIKFPDQDKPDPTHVSCHVTNRWLKFHDDSIEPRNNLILVDIMTLNYDDTPHKLCEVVLSIDELQAAITNIKKLYGLK